MIHTHSKSHTVFVRSWYLWVLRLLGHLILIPDTLKLFPGIYHLNTTLGTNQRVQVTCDAGHTGIGMFGCLVVGCSLLGYSLFVCSLSVCSVSVWSVVSVCFMFGCIMCSQPASSLSSASTPASLPQAPSQSEPSHPERDIEEHRKEGLVVLRCR